MMSTDAPPYTGYKAFILGWMVAVRTIKMDNSPRYPEASGAVGWGPFY